MENFDHVPQLDISSIWKDDIIELERLANEVKKIFTTVGFAYLINHQISTDAIYAASRQFHALPLEVKMRIKQNKFFRGYFPLEPQSGTKKTNQNDAFVIAYEVPIDHPDYVNGVYLAGPNQWPELDDLPNFKETVIGYRDTMLKLANRLVTVFSIAMGLGPYGLEEFFINPTYVLRLQRYPVQPTQIPEKQYGLAPHTDYGLFTILSQSDTDGLEIKCQNGEWLSAPFIPDTLVLNSGDALKRLTNDTFKSNLHRVVNRANRERYSIPFFYEPDMHSTLEVMPNYINKDCPAKYSPIEYGDYVVSRLQGDFGSLNTY
jgi:isopenicillin N synthase-like dioxygenase